MSWGVTAGTLIGCGAAAISGTVAVFAWRHRSSREALPFMGLALTLATWSLLYGVQLGYGTLADQLVWQRVTLGVAGSVPTAWLLFALAYTGRDDWLSRERVLLFLVEPVAFMLLCLTNPVHGLVWTGAVLTSTPVGYVPALDLGVGYVVHIAYAYAAVATGIGLLVLLGTRVAATYQKQVTLLVVGALPPFFSHVAFTFGASPVAHLDLTPFLFAFTGVVYGLALFRFQLLGLAPIARRRSLEVVGDGLVVVDSDGTIVDLFGVAEAVLDPTPAVGDRISTAFPGVDLEDLDGSDRTALVDGRRRVFQFRVSPLADHRDRRVGAMIMLRDITGLRESEQRLRVSNRVLRHNLRNDMTVVHGFASELESRLDGRDAADARKIRETAEDLLALSEKARQISELSDGGYGLREPTDVVREFRAVIEEIRSTHPGAELVLEAPSEVPIDSVDSETFRLAVRNVLDNAVRHDDSPETRVSIDVERTATGARVEISDDGPGIPEIERSALESGLETPLEHSQGLGLWLTHWCVSTWDGELDLESTGDGTTVTITVPGDGPTDG